MGPLGRQLRRAICVGSALLFVVSQSSVSGQSPHSLLAKFDTSTGLFLIPVGINDTKLWCNLDSGFSALLTLDERLVDRVGLTPGLARPTPDGRLPSPGDREARATVYVGGITLRDQPVILRAFPSKRLTCSA